jgi:hypothetical protein
MSYLTQAWPWYVGGVLIGLMVPALLIAGNKLLGVSGTMRQVCAACFPAGVPFLTYDWRKESWSLFFAAGIVIGGFVGGVLLQNPQPEAIAASTIRTMEAQGVPFDKGYLPSTLFSWSSLLTLKGFLVLVVGGFLVGFGTRYAGGCTSGHGIMGLSALQWPSLVAVATFFAAGILSAHFLLPFILSL